MQTHEFTVTETVRLDKLVAETVTTISRSQAKGAIEAGQITVDGQPAKPKDKPAVGATIHIELPDPQPLDVTPENIPLDIVYEDDDVIVVNKPQGMVVHPAPGHPNHTLVNALLYHSPLSSINGTL
ncbi:S4 domain-containing protein, partial [Levilactobacillus parabrevis]